MFQPKIGNVKIKLTKRTAETTPAQKKEGLVFGMIVGASVVAGLAVWSLMHR